MSVYVGIDVHRKRSQVAVIDQDGKVLANRNVNNGIEAILSVIGGLPPGTKAAFEAAFGWGWLAGLLEDYGFEPHLVRPLQCNAIASAWLKNDLLTELSDIAAAQQASRPCGRGSRSAKRRRRFPCRSAEAAAPTVELALLLMNGPSADCPENNTSEEPLPTPAANAIASPATASPATGVVSSIRRLWPWACRILCRTAIVAMSAREPSPPAIPIPSAPRATASSASKVARHYRQHS
jgi:hypothetical protein